MTKKNKSSRYGAGAGQNVLITLRVTDDERATIRRVAEARGVTIALLVRSGLTSMGVPGIRGREPDIDPRTARREAERAARRGGGK